MAEIFARLICVLVQKGILNLKDLIYIFGEQFYNQAVLTMCLIKNGIYTEEDLKKAMEEEDGKI